MSNNLFFMLFNCKRSIFSRLFVSLISVFLVAFLTVTVTWQINMKKSIYNTSLSHLMYISENSTDKFETNLNYLINEIESIATSEITLDYLSGRNESKTQELFKSLLRNCFDIYSPLTSGISAIDMNGNDISIGLSHIPEDYVNTQWYQQILNYTGKAQIFLRNFYGQDTSSYITIGCAATEYNKNIGVILLEISPNIFIKSFGESSIDGATRSIVTDISGNIIFCNDISMTAEERTEFVEYVSSADYYNRIGEFKAGKQKYMFTIQYSTYTGWKNITFFSKSIMENEYKTATQSTLFYIILVLILVVFIATVISVKLSKKISKLVKKIDSIDLNNLDESNTTFEDKSNDEIGIISNKFSKMLKTIYSQLFEIRTLAEQKRIDDIKALKSQITPHFLYNTLNVIDNLASIHSNTKISHITKNLIDLLRYSINDSSDLVPLEAELNYVKNYLEIMQTKFLREIYVSYDIDQSLLRCKTIKMILQPIAENCIKHGLTGKEGEYIQFKISKPDDNIEIKIIDNGKGIEQEKIDKILCTLDNNTEHLGLSNVDRRIKLTFGNEYGLDISSILGIQTAVKIVIPYIFEDENKKEIDEA